MLSDELPITIAVNGIAASISGIPQPDLSGLPTTTELTTELQSAVSKLPTKAELQTAIDGIPLSDLPTKMEVVEAIHSKPPVVVPHVDLAPLPTKLDLQAAIDGIPVTCKLPTTEEMQMNLNGLKHEIIEACKPIAMPPLPHLATIGPQLQKLLLEIGKVHAVLSNVPTKTEVLPPTKIDGLPPLESLSRKADRNLQLLLATTTDTATKKELDALRQDMDRFEKLVLVKLDLLMKFHGVGLPK